MAKVTTAQKIRIVIKAFDHKLVNDAATTIVEAIEKTGSVIAGPIPLPTQIKKFSVLRSTNCNKKAFEQFEIRTHKRIIDITESTADIIPTLEAIQLPSGVDIELKILAA